jgi:plasmid stabilization system protein ParE
MKRYKVVINADAENDIRDSYEWGVQNWEMSAADKWIRHLYTAIFTRLTEFPKSCPIAPESVDVEREVRQLLIARYRILFEIRGNEVIVLHVRGPYVAELLN